MNHAIFNQSNKVQFKSSKTEASQAEYVTHTMNIEACKNLTGTKEDWKKSINIQLSLNQVLELCAVMSGRIKTAEFYRQGKQVTFERQYDKEEPQKKPAYIYMYATSNEHGGIVINQKITWSDAKVIADIAVYQYAQNFGHGNIFEQLDSLKEQTERFRPQPAK